MLGVVGKGPSATALAAALDCPRFVLRNGVWTTIHWTRDGYITHLVRWGSAGLPPVPPVRAVLNHRIVFDKMVQLQRFHTAAVQVPRFEGDLYLDDIIGGGVRWLVRHRHHSGGTDINGVFTTVGAIEFLNSHPRHYAVEYIPKTHEWRVHVFRDEVLRIARKVWPAERGPRPDSPAWNIDSGYHFRYNLGLRPGTRIMLTDLGRRAVEALGMDFGAVDIIAKREGGGWRMYVLEVNSAPGIADNRFTLEAYVQAIRTWEANA